jgi:hypothetical protein
MGSSYSKIYTTLPKVAIHKEDYDKLQIQENEIGKLYKLFENIDADGNCYNHAF